MLTSYLLGAAASSTNSTDSGISIASLTLGAFGALVSLGAIALAVFQTMQLRDQVNKLETTQQDLSVTRQSIENQLKAVQEDMATLISGTEQSIHSLTGQMYEVLGISETAHQVPKLFQQLSELANNYSVLASQDLPFIKDIAVRQLEDLITSSTKSSSGVIEILPRDVDWVASELIQLAPDGSKVMTTSYVNTEDFWTRPAARDYLSRNKLAVTRNVTITRIFLFDSEESAKKSMHEMTGQCEAGIDVRTALTTHLDEDLARDMFLLDESMAAEFVLTPGRGTIREVRVWHAPNREVRETSDRLNRLARLSTQLRKSGEGNGSSLSESAADGPIIIDQLESQRGPDDALQSKATEI